MLTTPADAKASGSQGIDSTSSKAHRCAACGQGGQNQAIGRSRGGRTTKMHAVASGIRRIQTLNDDQPCSDDG
jgi:hypothetical protein